MASLPVGKLPVLLGLRTQTGHRLSVFCNRGAPVHVALGSFCGWLHGAAQIAVLCLFAGYEISKPPSGKSWDNIGGAFIEFGIGAGIVAGVVALWTLAH